MSKLDEPVYIGRLRFNFPPPEYKWFPTQEQFERWPFKCLLLFESLYVGCMLLLWLVAFTVGLAIGLIL